VVARLDRIKEEIGWLKVAFGISVAIVVSLVGWLAQNYASASPGLVVGAAAVLIIAAIAVVQVNRLAYDRFQKLEDV
jgi:hypothetical protein